MDYRLYFLESGHIRHFVPLECESDEGAIKAAEVHRDGREMELWQRARKVREFPATR